MTLIEMEKRLFSSFPDSEIEVIDLTGTEDHYEVRIVSSIFVGLSRIEQQRTVMRVFDPELKTGEVHALTIRTQSKAKGE